jgi:hypothetical protein
MSRSKRWTELHADLAEWWHKVTVTRGKSLPKGVDSTLAWYTNVDLRSIHTSEYRAPGDEEIRAAIIEARAATKRLSDLLWERERRMRSAS